MDTFSDTAEKARPHESGVNSSQIGGWARRNSIQKRYKINGNGVQEFVLEFNGFRVDLGAFLAQFWSQMGSKIE